MGTLDLLILTKNHSDSIDIEEVAMLAGRPEKLLELDVNQLIELIGAISKFGCETNKIKVDFADYVNTHSFDEPVRTQLRKIPAIIRSNLDPDAKMLAMQKYSTAVIQLILHDLIDQEHARFFKLKESEQADVIIQQLLDKSKEEATSQNDLESYKQNLVTQQNQMEHMAMLAIALSLKERVTFLEKHQIELFNEVSEKMYEALKRNGAFENLKDVNGNKVILTEQTQRNIVNHITEDFIDGFVEFSIQKQMIPLSDPQNLNNAQALHSVRLHAYEDNANNLFEEYHRHIENQMPTKIQNAFQNTNIIFNKSELGALRSNFQNEIKNNRESIIEMASERREIMQAKSILKNMKDMDPSFDTTIVQSIEKKNRFRAPP